MRSLDSAITNLLTAKGGLVVRHLVWIEARNRTTGLPETLGVWSGDYTLAVTIGGAARTYAFAGSALSIPEIVTVPGLSVRSLRLGLAAIDPAVENVVRNYDTRFAPVEIHRVVIDPATRQIAAAPYRVFKGLINSLQFPRAEPGGLAEVSLELVSENRVLTRGLPMKKSDHSQRQRSGDRIRRYGDISGVVPVYWGEEQIAPPATTAPTASPPAETSTDPIIYPGP